MTRLFEAKPFIIAEVGSNWQTLEHCLESIEQAKAVGADAVKFQAFDYEALYGVDYADDMTGQLPIHWLPKLKAKADQLGIEFMCTAFSPELVAAVDPYVEVHKVASSDLCYPQLLEAVAKTGKPVLLSLGASSNEERRMAWAVLDEARAMTISLVCTAAYPADFSDLKGVRCGFGLSDHTLGYTAVVEACRQGAPVIEKHFTAFPELDTPDRPHSLNPKQFKRMVDIIRGCEVESEESAMVLRHKRRLIATQDIEKGALLTFGSNYGAYRSLEDDTHGLSPFAWRSVEGQAAKVAIKRGKGIGQGDF